MSCSCVEKKVIQAEKGPKAIGPYSIGMQLGSLIFSAGLIGIDPVSSNLVPGGIQAETRQALNNLKAILEASGSGLDQVVKVTVFLKDINEFAQMNSVYAEFFTENPPARTTVQAAALPKGGAVEIDAIASSGECCCSCDCGEDCDCAGCGDCDCEEDKKP
jgi:2-iminobutanoate/2-iminopropanoate deaminase